MRRVLQSDLGNLHNTFHPLTPWGKQWQFVGIRCRLAPMPKRVGMLQADWGSISMACSFYTLCGGTVLRQGPGIGQGLMNSGGSCIRIGPGIGQGPTHGGSLVSKLNFLAVFPLFLG